MENIFDGKLEVVCTKYHAMNKGSFLGFASFKIMPLELEIYSCSVFQKGDKRWINLPSKEADQNGEKQYIPFASIKNREKSDAFNRACLQALDLFIAGDQGQTCFDQDQNQMPF